MRMSRLLNRSTAHRLLSPALVAGARERHRVLRVETSLGGFQEVTPYESAHDRPRPRKKREASRSHSGIASRHAFGTAPKYAATHATRAVGDEADGSIRQARVCQPGREHQGPRRLLDPHAGGRAR